jgi:membrane-associated phospholipid phosphatase
MLFLLLALNISIPPAILSDITVGSALVLDTKHSWDAPERWKALGCQGAKDGAVALIGLSGQHWITSPRPDGSGNGMPSLHSMYAASAFHSSNIWVNAILAGATAGLRVAAHRHTWLQVGVGIGAGAGTSFIRCGGS